MVFQDLRMLGRESLAGQIPRTKRSSQACGIKTRGARASPVPFWHQSRLLKPSALHYVAANQTEETHEKPARKPARKPACKPARQARRSPAGAVADDRFRGRPEQDHDRGGRRRL